MTTRRTWCLLAGLGLSFGAWSISQAQAQNALGTGNALDHNLSPASGGINAPVPIEDFRLRNQIITGNVAGGRGFRGSVGYSAENDFRGRLGSNDLYNFRADSAYSDPSVFGFGRSFDQLRYGQSMAAMEVPRSGTGASAGTLQAFGFRSDIMTTVARLRLDRAGNNISTAARLATASEPTLVGTIYDEEGHPYFVRTSPLRGVSVYGFNQAPELIGLNSMDEVRDRQDRAAGLNLPLVGTPYQTRFEKSAVDDQVKSPTDTTRVSTTVDAEYQKIIDRIIQDYTTQQRIDLKSDPTKLKNLDEQFRNLRAQLQGDQRLKFRDKNQSADKDKKAADESSSLIGIGPKQSSTPPSVVTGPTNKPDNGSGRSESSGQALPGSAPTQRSEPGAAPLTLPGDESTQPKAKTGDQPDESSIPATIVPLLRHGMKLPTLTAEDQSRFNELMKSGQQKLHEGEYFWAERRFERALRYSPGYPLASAGIAHAQLGAGLYLSASLTLRMLFVDHPEMIDVTYGDDALPPRERLLEISKLVQTFANDPEKDRAGYALVLAYLGRQIGDRALVDEGLRVLDLVEPQSSLPPVLKSIWLAPPAGATSPDTVPATAPGSTPQQ